MVTTDNKWIWQHSCHCNYFNIVYPMLNVREPKLPLNKAEPQQVMVHLFKRRQTHLIMAWNSQFGSAVSNCCSFCSLIAKCLARLSSRFCWIFSTSFTQLDFLRAGKFKYPTFFKSRQGDHIKQIKILRIP